MQDDGGTLIWADADPVLTVRNSANPRTIRLYHQYLDPMNCAYAELSTEGVVTYRVLGTGRIEPMLSDQDFQQNIREAQAQQGWVDWSVIRDSLIDDSAVLV